MYRIELDDVLKRIQFVSNLIVSKLLCIETNVNRSYVKRNNSYWDEKTKESRRLVPEIFKFEKCVKYANEMTDDVIHSTQYYIICVNRAILDNLQR